MEIVGTYRVYNANVHKLESLIHDFFHTARFYGSIVDYTYNRELQAFYSNKES